jgi:hypothetical protein
MGVLDGCYFIRLVVFWLGYAEVSFYVRKLFFGFFGSIFGFGNIFGYNVVFSNNFYCQSMDYFTVTTSQNRNNWTNL